MHGLKPIDPGRDIDWGKTSGDYALYRSGPPASFYERLRALGVGLPGQRVLDLGTGTGVIARQLARQGAQVVGVDLAAEQVATALKLSREEGLETGFVASPAEAAPFRSGVFDAITANQCWLYFDKIKTVEQVKRMLAPGGVLVTSHNCWLPREDAIAAASEALVLKHNPAWTAGDWHGLIPPIPAWSRGLLRVRAHFWYDEPVPFTREAWRGRMRACRGVGATLAPEEVERFDREHAALLERIAPPEFAIVHRIDAHVFEVSP